MTSKPNPNDYYSMEPDDRDCVADDPTHADNDDAFDADLLARDHEPFYSAAEFVAEVRADQRERGNHAKR